MVKHPLSKFNKYFLCFHAAKNVSSKKTTTFVYTLINKWKFIRFYFIVLNASKARRFILQRILYVHFQSTQRFALICEKNTMVKCLFVFKSIQTVYWTTTWSTLIGIFCTISLNKALENAKSKNRVNTWVNLLKPHGMIKWQKPSLHKFVRLTLLLEVNIQL